MYLKTEGIVLREVELGEADKLLDILSRDRGLLTVKAKGVRRAKSPLKSACQILTLSEFTLFDYRGKLSVQEAEPLEQFRGLRENLEQLALGSYFAQATGAVAQEDAPNPELISLLCNALFALSKLGRPQALVKAAFELRLACLAGFAPELSACPVCGSGAPDRFDLSQGMVFCEGCREGETGIRLPVSPGMLLAMRYIVWCEPKKLFSFRLEGEGLRALSSLTEAYLMTQLEHSFYTLDFYKSLMNQTENLYD
ncbi:MAG: DNA repair protein RecO [Oscillospiraceae bacterium]|nr:DNA repair protein RecO [Oscillospiraceae bacterium]